MKRLKSKWNIGRFLFLFFSIFTLLPPSFCLTLFFFECLFRNSITLGGLENHPNGRNYFWWRRRNDLFNYPRRTDIEKYESQ